MHFRNAGDIEIGHTHAHDHLTLLASGRLQVKIGDKLTMFTAPHMILISKDNVHELVALENNTVAYCIHALRDADKSGDIVSPDMIPNGSTFASLIKDGQIEPLVP